MLWDIKPEKTDSGLIFTDPDEKWLIRFYPLTYDRKIRVYDNLTNVFGEDGSKVKDKNLAPFPLKKGTMEIQAISTNVIHGLWM